MILVRRRTRSWTSDWLPPAAEPLVDVSLFTRPAFAAANLAALIVAAGLPTAADRLLFVARLHDALLLSSVALIVTAAVILPSLRRP